MKPGWLIVEALTRDHDRSSFHCGEPSLDDYFRRFASQQQRGHHAAVYVATDRNAPHQIFGYYTLSANAIATERLRETLGSSLPAYDLTPTTLLGRLAVDQSAQGRGLGSHLLIDALLRSYAQSSIVGSHAVVVDALNDGVAAWYERNGFRRLGGNKFQLVIPMKLIQRLYST